MVDQYLRDWAGANGYDCQQKAVLAARQGFGVAYAFWPVYSRYGVCVQVEEATCPKEVERELRKLLKGCGKLVYIRNTGHLILQVKRPFGQAKLYERLETATEGLLNALHEMGVRPEEDCKICGAGGAEDCFVEDKSGYAVHASCKQRQADRILAEVEENEVNGNYALGALCALLGGVVGAIPSVLLLYFTGYISVWLYALIPLAAAFGYKLGKGVLNWAMPVIVAVVSLVCNILPVLCSVYADLQEYFGEWIGVGDFMEYVLHPSARMHLALNAIMPTIWCILGIFVASGYIRKTNKEKVRRAGELRRRAMK